MAEGFLCVLLDGIYNMANDVVFTLIQHTVLSSLYDCFVMTALHLGNILVASQMFGRYYGYLVGGTLYAAVTACWLEPVGIGKYPC